MKRREFVSGMGMVATGIALSGPSALSAAPPKIRVGQIGTRHAHAAGKMESLRRSSEYEVVGVTLEDGVTKPASRPSVYDGVPVIEEERLLGDPTVRMIAIETDIKGLLGTARRAIAAGKHVHLDKPAGESLPEFRKLMKEAEEKKLTVQMGYMYRYNPGFQFCFDAVRKGWLGNIFRVHAVIGKVMSPDARATLKPYPGGSMFELGCHVMDAVVKVMGRPEKVTAHNRSSSPLKDGFADNQLAVLDYSNGTASVHSSIIDVDGFARRQFVVCGDRGTVEIRPLEQPRVKLALLEAKDGYRRGYQDVEVPTYRRYDGDFADLAKVIRGEKEFEFSPQHDLAVQEAVLRGSGLSVE